MKIRNINIYVKKWFVYFKNPYVLVKILKNHKKVEVFEKKENGK
jgi:hypothetical protein